MRFVRDLYEEAPAAVQILKVPQVQKGGFSCGAKGYRLSPVSEEIVENVLKVFVWNPSTFIRTHV